MEKESIRENNLKKSNRESKELTRRYIRTSMMHLMKEKEIKDITVTSIIQKAGVSRAGFYRNYTCKEEVLDDISDNLYEDFKAYYINELSDKESYEKYRKLFERLRERAEWFDILLKAQSMKEYTFEMNYYLKPLVKAHDTEDYYRHVAIANAQRAIIREWFYKGMRETPEEMAGYFCQFFEDGPFLIFT